MITEMVPYYKVVVNKIIWPLRTWVFSNNGHEKIIIKQFFFYKNLMEIFGLEYGIMNILI
jgi:hypothetical protein